MLKKILIFVLTFFTFIGCYTTDNESLLIFKSEDNLSKIKAESFLITDFPFKAMSFVSINNLNEISHNTKITYSINDYGFIDFEKIVVVHSFDENSTFIDKANISRVNENQLQININNEYVGKYNSLFVGQYNEEGIDFKLLNHNKYVKKDKYLIYVQGTTPVPESDMTISMRPIFPLVSEHYKKIYFFSYNMGFPIKYKVPILAQYIIDNIPVDAELDIIGESQGTLITRCIMYEYPEIKGRIRKFISLCGPNEGVVIANENFVLNILNYVIDISYEEDKELYRTIVNGINMIAFELLPELVDMRENSNFIAELNSKMTKEIADKMYFFAGNLDPGTNFGDLIARKSSALYESCNFISNDRRFEYSYLSHPQAIFSYDIALKICEILLED